MRLVILGNGVEKWHRSSKRAGRCSLRDHGVGGLPTSASAGIIHHRYSLVTTAVETPPATDNVRLTSRPGSSVSIHRSRDEPVQEVPIMADRTLRGSRLGAISYETEYGAEPAPRNVAAYRCQRGHEFSVPFSEEAEIPTTWECRLDGTTRAAHRRPRAGGQEGQAAAYPLGHADGAAHDRRPRRGARRAPGRAARPPRRRRAPDALARTTTAVTGQLTVRTASSVRFEPSRLLAAQRGTHLARRGAAAPHSVTRTNASRTIAPLIFDSPRSRSAKVIGTSTTRKPAPQRAPGQVDLEAVALRADRARSRCASSTVAPVGAVAAGGVAHVDTRAPAGRRGCRRARAPRGGAAS